MKDGILQMEEQSGKIRSTLFWFFSTLIAGFVAINNQSFWIDESISSLLSGQDSLKSLWTLLTERNESDIQMPLYVLYSWSWEKIFGTGEIVSRMSNMPLLFIGSWFFRKKPLALILFLVSPLLIYYVGEYRVYTSLIVVSVWVAFYLFLIRNHNGELKLNPFYGGLLLLCSLSLLGVVWSIGAFAAMTVIVGKRLQTWCFWRTTFFWSLPFMVLAAYYFYILYHGANPAPIVSSVPVNILQSCYEIAGFSGFGPGRLEARDNIYNAIPYIPWLILFGVVVVTTWFYSLKTWIKDYGWKLFVALLLAIILPFILLSVMSVFRDFRFSGRHCAPLFGYYIVILVYWFIRNRWCDWSNGKRCLYFATLVVFLISSFNVRFSPRFERENYREAVAYVNHQINKGKKVVWIGIFVSGKFYGLDDKSLPSEATQWDEVDEVVFTRLDLHPEYRTPVEKLLQSGRYEVKPFVRGFSKLEPVKGTN